MLGLKVCLDPNHGLKYHHVMVGECLYITELRIGSLFPGRQFGDGSSTVGRILPHLTHPERCLTDSCVIGDIW